MLRGLFLTLMYTQKQGEYKLRGKNNQSDFWESTLGKSTMYKKQENMDSGSPPLFSSWGTSFFFTQKTCLPFDVLGAWLDLSQQKAACGPEKILFPSGGGSICFFLSHKWDWGGMWEWNKRSHGSNLPSLTQTFLSLCTQWKFLEPGKLERKYFKEALAGFYRSHCFAPCAISSQGMNNMWLNSKCVSRVTFHAAIYFFN